MSDADSVKEAVQDVLDGRREFTLEIEDEIFHYYVASPSGEDIRKSDWQYSKIYNQAIVDGFLTQAQMVDILQEKGIIDDTYSEELETVRISLGAELFKLENLMENALEEEKELAAMEVARLRDELFRLNQRVNGPMANTCENLAEDARTEFLTSRIVQKKDGTRLWEDFGAFRDEENTALAIKSRFEVMLWMQGLESNFLENTPEQTALREIAQARLDRAVADAEEETETDLEPEVESVELPADTSNAEPEEVSSEKPKKKRGRPKGKKNKPKTAKKPSKEE